MTQVANVLRAVKSIVIQELRKIFFHWSGV